METEQDFGTDVQGPDSDDRPMPPSLTSRRAAVKRPSWLEWLIARRLILVGLIVVGALVVVASGLSVWLASTGRLPFAAATPPLPRLVLPPSLGELVRQYPELAGLLNDPALSSVYKDFLVAYETGGIEAAEELAQRRGLLNERDEIRITLVLEDVRHAVPISTELRGVGITVEGAYRDRINVGVPMSLIQQLTAEQGAHAFFQQLRRIKHIVRIELPVPKRPDSAQRIEGEGVGIVGADAWHAAGLTGDAIRVGILDLGFRGYTELLGSELPSEVVARSFVYDQTPEENAQNHGTACAEIVHETAPGASLFLASYDGSMVSQGQAVEWLLDQRVHIISHSAGGILGPMDGTGKDATYVDEIVATGVLWVNSAGNAAESHYRGQFADIDGDGLHEFPDGDERMAVWPYADSLLIVLNWDDWQMVTQDYDLHLYDSQGGLVASARDTQNGAPGQMAAEGVMLNQLSDSLYYVVIESYATDRPAVFDLYADPAEIEFPVVEHSLGTPGDARGAFTVGATEYRDDSLAAYSSNGPTNDGRLKPEISAPAGVSGAVYGPDGFDGTSASTPYIAGAAALVWGAYPNLDGRQVAGYLKAHVLDLGAAGPDNSFGHGRLSLPVPGSAVAQPTAAPPEGPPPVETAVPTVRPPVVGLAPTPVTDLEVGTAEGGLSPTLLAVVSLTGLCGVAVLAGGVALLLVAWRRSVLPPTDQDAITPGAEYVPASVTAPEASDVERYGVLAGHGIAPVPLMPGVTVVGRATDAGIRLQSPQVSRRHARIACAEGRCILVDLQSANGTFVNGRRVEEAVLALGDRLRLGDVVLTYTAVGPRASVRGGAAPYLESEGVHYPIGAEGLTMGRAGDVDLQLDDERVSRHHARIALGGEGMEVIDLGSANGTHVNGRSVGRQILHDGDVIALGDSRLVFRDRVR